MDKLTTNRPDEWKGNIVFDTHNHGHDLEEFFKSLCKVESVENFHLNVNTNDLESTVIVNDKNGNAKSAQIDLIDFLKNFKEISFDGSF